MARFGCIGGAVVCPSRQTLEVNIVHASFQWSWESGPMPQPWASLFMAFAGFILLGVCVHVVFEDRAFASTAVRTTGTVVDLHQRQGTSHPEISFIDAHGHEHRIGAKVQSSPPAFYKGERVVVLYPANAPTQARIDSFLENWLVPLITGALGSISLLVSALTWVYRKRLFPQYSTLRRSKQRKS
jgi:hypothetical protein